METVPSPQPKKHFLKEVLQFTLIALVIILPLRFFVAQPFVVSGASMDPTFNDGNYLIVDELSYRFESPRRGDVVVFKYPYDEKRYLIKRVIGLPGETVEMKAGAIIIKNGANKEGLSLDEPYIDDKNNLMYGNLSVTLGDDEYFVMGDNRIASSDSRIWGPLKRELIVGRPLVRLLPVGRLGLMPGSYHGYADF